MQIPRAISIELDVWEKFRDLAFSRKKSRCEIISELIRTLIKQNATLDDFGEVIQKEDPRFFSPISEIQDYIFSLKEDDKKSKAFSFKLQEWTGKFNAI